MGNSNNKTKGGGKNTARGGSKVSGSQVDESDQRTMRRIRDDRIMRAAIADWEKLEKGTSEPVSEQAQDQMTPDNQSKNRYGNVRPLDRTRVILKNGESDYINASWVDGLHKNSVHAYIATQAPLPHTIPDFWQMVWQEESYIIVMLTKLQESNKIKAHQYWPETQDDPLEAGRFVISLLKEEFIPKITRTTDQVGTAFIIRHLSLLETESKMKRTVFQAHYCSWPDMQVPNNGEDLIAMMTTVNNLVKQTQNAKTAKSTDPNITHPIIVHCSAGLGRAGTFILIHTTLHHAIENGLSFEDIKIIDILSKLREHRSGLVQTKDQYLFGVKTIKSQLDEIARTPRELP